MKVVDHLNKRVEMVLLGQRRHGVFVDCSPFSQVSASTKKFRTSCDKLRTSGKLLAARPAGIGTGSGQLTLGEGGFVAHPAKLVRQVVSVSERTITRLPGGHDGTSVLSFTRTILLLQCERTARIILTQRGDVLAVDRCGILVPGDENPNGRRQRRPHIPRHSTTVQPKNGFAMPVH